MERRLWLLTLVLLTTVYLTLSVVRPVAEFLRERGLLRFSMLAILLALGAVLVFALMRGGRRRLPSGREALVLVLAAGLYVAILSTMERAEEAFHFVEYGLVGGMVYGALLGREQRLYRGGEGPLHPALGPAMMAALITFAAGSLDEGIQKLLPTRVFDVRDLVFNGAAGILGIAVVTAWLLSRRSAAAPEPRDPSAP